MESAWSAIQSHSSWATRRGRLQYIQPSSQLMSSHSQRLPHLLSPRAALTAVPRVRPTLDPSEPRSSQGRTSASKPHRARDIGNVCGRWTWPTSLSSVTWLSGGGHLIQCFPSHVPMARLEKQLMVEEDSALHRDPCLLNPAGPLAPKWLWETSTKQTVKSSGVIYTITFTCQERKHLSKLGTKWQEVNTFKYAHFTQPKENWHAHVFQKRTPLFNSHFTLLIQDYLAGQKQFGVCNPSYLEGWDPEDHSSRAAQAKKFVRPHLNRGKKLGKNHKIGGSKSRPPWAIEIFIQNKFY
jgi:hypothetical protein